MEDDVKILRHPSRTWVIFYSIVLDEDKAADGGCCTCHLKANFQLEREPRIGRKIAQEIEQRTITVHDSLYAFNAVNVRKILVFEFLNFANDILAQIYSNTANNISIILHLLQ